MSDTTIVKINGSKGNPRGKKIDKVNAIVSTNDGLREWAARIKDCQNRPTGMSITDWCKNQGIKESKYYYWFYRVKKVCPEVVQGEMPIQQETIVQSELSEAVQGETSIRQVIPLQPVLLRQQEQDEGTPQQGVDISVKGLTIHVTESTSMSLLVEVPRYFLAEHLPCLWRGLDQSHIKGRVQKFPVKAGIGL